jgi:hypothetical protein
VSDQYRPDLAYIHDAGFGRAGFRVERLDAYGELVLPRGIVGVLAQK